MNRLRMQHRASFLAAEREVERIEIRRKKLIEMVKDGVAPSVVKAELNANAARREQLGSPARRRGRAEPAPSSGNGRIYRAKVTELARALQEPDSRSDATEALRGLVDAIVLTPDQASETLQIESGGTWRPCWEPPFKRRGRRNPTTSSCKYLWLRGGDLNPRPLGYEPNELPDCSTPRHGSPKYNTGQNATAPSAQRRRNRHGRASIHTSPLQARLPHAFSHETPASRPRARCRARLGTAPNAIEIPGRTRGLTHGRDQRRASAAARSGGRPSVRRVLPGTDVRARARRRGALRPRGGPERRGTQRATAARGAARPAHRAARPPASRSRPDRWCRASPSRNSAAPRPWP